MSDSTKIMWARDIDHFERLTASKTPAWIYSEDKSDVLYNLYVDFTKLCPIDYRVPTHAIASKLLERRKIGKNYTKQLAQMVTTRRGYTPL